MLNQRRKMKRARLTSSRSPRRIHFTPSEPDTIGILGSIPRDSDFSTQPNTMTAAHSTTMFVARVKSALQGRPEMYKEFLTALDDLKRSRGEDQMEIIERMITALDGNRRLINDLVVVLPDEYVLDVQDDAVIIRVLDAGRKSYNMIDTGNSRTTPRSSGWRGSSSSGINSSRSSSGRSLDRMHIREDSAAQYHSRSARSYADTLSTRSLLSTKISFSSPRPKQIIGPASSPREMNGVPASESPRGRSQLTTRPLGTQPMSPRSTSASIRKYIHLSGSVTPDGTPRYTTTDLPRAQRDGTMNYIADVKEAMSHRPKSYRHFIKTLGLYHTGRMTEPEVVHRVVRLLQSRPDLILAFNEFLPQGHRIKSFDASRAYVLEYPCSDGVGLEHEFISMTI